MSIKAKLEDMARRLSAGRDVAGVTHAALDSEDRDVLGDDDGGELLDDSDRSPRRVVTVDGGQSKSAFLDFGNGDDDDLLDLRQQEYYPTPAAPPAGSLKVSGMSKDMAFADDVRRTNSVGRTTFDDGDDSDSSDDLEVRRGRGTSAGSTFSSASAAAGAGRFAPAAAALDAEDELEFAAQTALLASLMNSANAPVVAPKGAPTPAEERGGVERRNMMAVGKALVHWLVNNYADDSCTEDSNEYIGQLFVLLENTFAHGLRSTRRTRKRGWYGFLESAAQSVLGSCVERVGALGLATNAGNGRALIRMALAEKRLSEYLQAGIADAALTAEWYEPWAMMCSEEGVFLMGLLTALNALDFDDPKLRQSRARGWGLGLAPGAEGAGRRLAASPASAWFELDHDALPAVDYGFFLKLEMRRKRQRGGDDLEEDEAAAAAAAEGVDLLGLHDDATTAAGAAGAAGPEGAAGPTAEASGEVLALRQRIAELKAELEAKNVEMENEAGRLHAAQAELSLLQERTLAEEEEGGGEGDTSATSMFG